VLRFFVGNILLFVQHIALVTLLLTDFQKRLLNAERAALDLAYHGSLTGLSNTRYMELLFEQGASIAQRTRHLIAVILST